MSQRSYRWLKLLIFAFFILVASTKVTDADLIAIEKIRDNFFKALTLDISNKQTANNYPTSQLFNVTGIVPGGFQVESVRIQNDGEIQPNFRIIANKTAGDDTFCNVLNLRILHNWQTVYNAKLMTFSYESTLSNKNYDDLIFIISLDQDIAPLNNRTCQFNFIVYTIQGGDNQQIGFYDEEVLQNVINSGAW